MPDSRIRPVRTVFPAIETEEGEGFIVHRPFPVHALRQVDPFLLLDEMGPVDYRPGEAKGAPDHPHRGFETVTYLVEGEFEHEDSAGHRGRLRPGDVQWMTAGAGVVHSEVPSREFQKRGGRMHGFQIWVNLAARDKRVPPHYQEFAREGLPEVKGPGWSAKLIAGSLLGASSPIQTRTPSLLWDLRLEPGTATELAVPADFEVMAYVFEGGSEFPGGTVARAHELVLFEREGQAIAIRAADSAASRMLILGGRPIGEPVARYGPFVMNTPAEIHEAIEDFQAGRMGEIRRDGK